MPNGNFQNYPKADFGLYCEWNAPHNVNGNYSSVGVSVYLTYRSLDIGSRTCTVVINGESARISVPAISDYSSGVKKKLIAQRTVDVPHNSDGTKSCSISASYDLRATYSGTYYSELSVGNTVALFSIPRQSTITTYTEGVTVNGTNALSVNFKPNVSTYSHEFVVVFGNFRHSEILQAGRTSASFAIPLKWLEAIPYHQEGTGGLSIITKNGNNVIGSIDSRTFKVWVHESVLPVITSLTVEAVNDNPVVNSWGIFLKGYSKAKLTCKGYGVYGAPISTYQFTGRYNITQSSNTYTGDILNNAGNDKFNCCVKDTRGKGRWGEEQFIYVHDYQKPQITEASVKRHPANNKKIIIKSNYTYSDLEGRNSSKLRFYYKKTSSSEWLFHSDIEKNRELVPVQDFEETSSYDFRFHVSDSLGNVSISEASISTIDVLLDFKAGGKGLGIGKIAEHDCLEIGMATKFLSDVSFGGRSLLDITYPIGSLYLTIKPQNPAEYFGGRWERRSNGRTLFGVDESDGDFNYVGKSGGEKTHKLTESEMPNHTHIQDYHNHTVNAGIPAYGKIQTISPTSNTSGSKSYYIKFSGVTDISGQDLFAAASTAVNKHSGGDQPHNNLPPYWTCYIWERVG